MSVPDVDLSVVMVTHNGRDLALATLRSAVAATGALSVEWIVVDSASTDGTPEAIQAAFSDVRVLCRPNRGFAAGNNAGLREARGRYVLLLNPDVEVRAGALDRLVAAMDARPEVGLASVVQRGPDDRLQPSIRRFPTAGRDLGEALFAARWPMLRTLQELETRPGAYAREHSVDWLVGAFLVARRDAIAEVGPMDERFFLYSEEVDWCYRFRRAGWDVRHLPVMTVTHHAGRRDGGDLMAQLSHSRLLFAGKHLGRVERIGIRWALGLGHALRVLVFGPPAVVRPWLRPRLRAELAGLSVTLGLTGPPYGVGRR